MLSIFYDVSLKGKRIEICVTQGMSMSLKLPIACAQMLEHCLLARVRMLFFSISTASHAAKKTNLCSV